MNTTYINYYIEEFDTDLYQIKVDMRLPTEDERVYLANISQLCVSDYFNDDRMEECRCVTVRFNDPYSDTLWHEFCVKPYQFVAVPGSYRPLTQADAIGDPL